MQYYLLVMGYAMNYLKKQFESLPNKKMKFASLYHLIAYFNLINLIFYGKCLCTCISW